MPHDKPGKLRREGDERLREDREATDGSLSAERKVAGALLRELENALSGLHPAERVRGRAAELDHGANPLQEETIRHEIANPTNIRASEEGGPSEWRSARHRVEEWSGRMARARVQTDENLRRERAQVERLLTHAMALASTDALTDLVNSRVFTEVLSAQSDMCRTGEQSFGLMYLDLDNFKRVNDLYGHVAGDLLLRKISNLIRRNVRREDVAARLGGDEFGILVSGLPRVNVEAIARRVIESIRGLDEDYPDAGLGASLGLVYMDCSKSHQVAAEELLRMADAAMYEAKASGKQTVMITFPEDAEP